MSTKLKLLSVILVLILFLSGFYVSAVHSSSGNTTTLLVIKTNGIWKVVDAADTSNTEIKVKKKDTIIWKVKGTDAVFQFPLKLFKPADSSDVLTDGYTKAVKNGHKLKLMVRSDAASGIYEYAVFCKVDGVFAKGGSPPRIIVE